MSESPFIGRHPHLDDIQQHIHHCLSGQPRVLLIEGLAGIGKTRFLEEIQAMAGQQGMDVYTGYCDETLTEPYQPFTGLLPRLEDEEALATPELSFLHRFLGGAGQTQPVLALDVARQDNLDLLVTLSRGLIRLAEDQPFLLIVENLHVADQPSLDLFAYLTFALAERRTAPLFLVASHRPAAPDTAVGRLLSRLQPEGIVHTLELSGLEEPETREFLQNMGVTQPTQQLVHAIHAATQGIPLFVQEAVHHALRTGALYTRGGYLAVHQDAVASLQLPQDISDAIMGRIDALPADCQDVLSAVSLLGDGFQADDLGILEQLDPRTTESALATAIDQGILRRDEDRYHFAHTLIRRAFASRLRLEHRQRIHLNIAQTLDRLYADAPNSHALEIVHHLLETGAFADSQLLRKYAELAGNQAFSRFAWSDAARYYEAALSTIQLHPNRAMLHYQSGLSHYRNQDAGPALEHFQEAMTDYKSIGDTAGLAQALMWLVRIRLTSAAVPMGILPPYVETLEAALETLDAEERSLRGHIMAVLAQAYRPARQTEKAMELAQAALEIGQEANDDRLIAQAGEALGLAHMSHLQVERAIVHWKESLQSARATGDFYLQRLALTNLPLALNLQGSIEEAETFALEGRQLTQTLQDWSEHSKALSHLASLAVVKGNFQTVQRYARDTMVMVERSHYPWGGFRALHALAGASAARGLSDEANQALQTLGTPGKVFATPGRIVQVFNRVFRQLILAYSSKQFTERIASLHDDLMEVVAYDTYSLAPLCAMIELGQKCLMPEFTERPAQITGPIMCHDRTRSKVLNARIYRTPGTNVESGSGTRHRILQRLVLSHPAFARPGRQDAGRLGTGRSVFSASDHLSHSRQCVAGIGPHLY